MHVYAKRESVTVVGVPVYHCVLHSVCDYVRGGCSEIEFKIKRKLFKPLDRAGVFVQLFDTSVKAR